MEDWRLAAKQGKGTKKKKDKGQKRKIKLGKIDGLIRSYNQSTKIDGKVKTCTVNRKDMGRYYRYSASITYKDVPKSYPEPKGPIGVDVGVSNIAALSDGTVFRNDHVYAKKESKFRKEHRKLSKIQPNTPEYLKQRTKLNHSYEKVSNHRKNNVEQISNHIVKNHDIIAMEDLSVKQLRSISRNKRMTKGYNDASIGVLRKRICDKAESAGRTIVLVDPKGTSQICSNCQEVVEKDLSVRTHVCPHCGYDTLYVDGVKHGTLSAADINHRWYQDVPEDFNRPMYLILQNQIISEAYAEANSSWLAGRGATSSDFPMDMSVDYIRIYQSVSNNQAAGVTDTLFVK